jgi:hypothetical protein
MGFLDLSTNVAAKKYVDFNDARYQLSDKLRQSENKNVRYTFTLYDNKEYKKIAVQEISAAYALSDKRLPIGELLNKMVDLILDMEDGVLNSEKDAIYAWKYSIALLEMFEDKVKRQESLAAFDNSLKTSLINSTTFIERYPGKYTVRTNFFDEQIKLGLIKDVVDTFKLFALPGIHEAAIQQSHEKAEKHNNPILDKIVNWAIENYNCEVDSFYEIKKDEKTNLFFSVNTVILHLKNGYDMSIIGHTGTDYDDKFAISVLDAQKITMETHNERVSQNDVQKAMEEASKNATINPLARLIKIEKNKNDVLKEQYDILASIRPMISEEILKIRAAESVVGQDYIWGCAKFRETHEDLPNDFKLEDVILPEYIEVEEQGLESKNKDYISDMMNLADSVEVVHEATADTVEEKVVDMVEEVEFTKQENSNLFDRNANTQQQPVTIPGFAKEKTSEDVLKTVEQMQSLFDDEPQEKEEELLFGDPRKSKFEMPMLGIQNTQGGYSSVQSSNEKKKTAEFDPSSTLLPGAIPVMKKEEPTGPSITGDAKQIPIDMSTSTGYDSLDSLFDDDSTNQSNVQINQPVEMKPETHIDETSGPEEPELFLDDLSSLFE